VCLGQRLVVVSMYIHLQGGVLVTYDCEFSHKPYTIDTSWFSSSLNKRFQQTHYVGAISDKKEVISSVPQGSVLGPILFLIYVNDLPLSLSSTCADIFVDDTTIGTPSHSIDTLVEP